MIPSVKVIFKQDFLKAIENSDYSVIYEDRVKILIATKTFSIVILKRNNWQPYFIFNIETKLWPQALQHKIISWISFFLCVWVPISGLLFGFSEDKWDQTWRGCCWTGASDVATHTQWVCKSVLVSVRRQKVHIFHLKYIYSWNVTVVAFYNSAQHILYRLECGVFQRLIVYYLAWRMNNSSLPTVIVPNL